MSDPCQVNDMYLAAAILAYGGKLGVVDRSNKSRQKFVFNDTDLEVYIIEDGNVVRKKVNLEQFVTFYRSNQMLFPKTIIESIRDVKSEIHRID